MDNATVLVSDDDDAVRSLACRVLRKHGFHVLEASNGVHAIAIAHEHAGEIDLLLSDVTMPQMGGLELLEQLRNVRPQIKVVFMSGYTSDAVLQPASDNCGFLEKPFTPNALVSKVREVLRSP